jgi:ABC-type phosphate/phosphonate transport system substrate-binding protein
MARPILVGAVIYDPKVAVIWDIIKDFFWAQGCPMDYVFYSNYALQVEALLAGHIDIAWNSPLAWVEARRRSQGAVRAIAMRDTDRDRVSHILVARDGPVRRPQDLEGRTLATGAVDSPQATLLPLHHLRRWGLVGGQNLKVRRFDVLVGKHGDHVGGELEALRCLMAGEADACCVLDLNWERWKADGTADPARLAVLTTTDPFDHCNFTVLESFPRPREERWLEVLLRMSYDNPAHREMMDMEGLKQWLAGRTSGYAPLEQAVDELAFFSPPERAAAHP